MIEALRNIEAAANALFGMFALTDLLLAAILFQVMNRKRGDAEPEADEDKQEETT